MIENRLKKAGRRQKAKPLASGKSEGTRNRPVRQDNIIYIGNNTINMAPLQAHAAAVGECFRE
jgi:hypothetical protein